MKKFQLDLSEYEIEILEHKPTKEDPKNVETKQEMYPLRDNISMWLRAAGIFKTGEEIAEAVILGKAIEKSQIDEYLLDEREAEILKNCLNKHLALTEAGRVRFPLGGVIHEEAICRIFGMKEVE